MIKKEQCISVTDLKQNANTYIKNIQEPKVIFVNNKPKAVIIEFDQYQKFFVEEQFSFTFDPPVKPSEILRDYEKNVNIKAKSDNKEI